MVRVHGSTVGRLAVALGAALLLASACGSNGGGSSTGGGGASAPGVTSDTITVGTIATQTGPVPGLFKGAITGVQAYFAYVNSKGGVAGHKLKVKTGDDALNCAQEASQVSQLSSSVFAFVGSFVLTDDCGVKLLSKKPTLPWIAYGFGENIKKLPQYYSPVPNPTGFVTGPWPYLMKTYGVSTVGFLYSSSAASTQLAELEAMKSTGVKVGYQRAVTPTETNFSADVQRMKSSGVDWVFADFPPSTAKILLTQLKQADFHPKLVQNAALYGDGSLQQLGDPKLAEGVIGTPGFGMFLGEDDTPGVNLFNEWVKKVSSSSGHDLYAVYGWASAKLFVDTLEKSGSTITQQSFLDAIKGVHQFDTQGLLPVTDPGAKKPSTCWMQFQVKDGRFLRAHPDSAFDCSGSYLQKS